MKISTKLAQDTHIIRHLSKLTNIPLNRGKESQSYVSSRFTISQAFQVFTRKVIPSLEEAIEEKLIGDIYNKMDSEALRNELMMSYQRRRLKIENYTRDEEKESVEEAEFSNPLEKAVYTHVSFDNINHTSDRTVGLYHLDNIENKEKFYPDGFYGDFDIFLFNKAPIFSMMCPKEANDVIEVMRWHDHVFENTLDVESLVNCYVLDEDFALIVKNDRKMYFSLFRLVALEVREALYEDRNSQFVNDKLYDSFLFDILIHSFLKQSFSSISLRMALANPTTRKEVCKNLWRQAIDKSDQEFVNYVAAHEWLQDIGSISLQIEEYGLKKVRGEDTPFKTGNTFTQIISFANIEHYLDVVDHDRQSFSFGPFLGANSGIMIHGDQGTGKTGNLAYISNYAYHNDWIVVKIPNVYDWTMNMENPLERNEMNRLYMHNNNCQKILENLIKIYGSKLEAMPLDMELFGKFDSGGVHQDEPPAVKNTYNEWRRTYFFEMDNFPLESDRDEMLNYQRYLLQNVAERFPNPQNMLELAQYGIDNEEWALNSLAEVMEQLYNQETHKVLVAVDGFNWFFRKSDYTDGRYEPDPLLRGMVPPYHIAECRMFMRFDGHKIKNGLKVVSSCLKHLNRHTFEPSKINYPEGFDIKAQPIELDQIRNSISHFCNIGHLDGRFQEERVSQLFFLETQGNWRQLAEVLDNPFIRTLSGKFSERIRGTKYPHVRYHEIEASG